MRLKRDQIPEHLLKYFKPVYKPFILRNDIIWASINKMCESVEDRFSKKYEHVFFFVKKSKGYYFDLDAIRELCKDTSIKRTRYKWNGHREKGSSYEGMDISKMCNPKGKNPGDVSDFWDIPIRGNNDKHYASYNFKLIEKPILAGCPENGIILDPFCGSGTTLVTAYKLNRNFIGFDGNQEYVDMSLKNIKKAKKNKRNVKITKFF